MRLYTIAMLDEYKDILEIFGSELKNEKYQDIQYLISKKFIIVEIGIGKINATFKLVAFLEYIKKTHIIDLIINVGFAGAQGYNLYDIVKVEKARFSDFNLEIMGYLPGQMPGCEQNFLTSYNLEETFSKKDGMLFTADHFQQEKFKFSTCEKYNKYLCDMEGCAVLYVANKYKIKCLMYKVVSDIIDEKDQEKTYSEVEENSGSLIIKNVFLDIEALFGERHE